MNYYYVKVLYINRKVTVLDQNQKEIGVYHNIKVKVLDSKRNLIDNLIYNLIFILSS